HYADRPEPAGWPQGWAPDSAAFHCGLDQSTLELTAADRKNLFEWYERTIGEVPRSVQFCAQYNPEFLKAYRAKWENAFRGALPKQMMPYIMLRNSSIYGRREGIREAALLAKAWGMEKRWVVFGVTHVGFYFTGMDGMYVVEDALRDVLADW